MRRIFLILIAAVAFSTLSARAADSLFRFSLLTCSPGTSSSTIYGHSAIRVQDPISKMDIVFNYGSYSFNEPHFFWKFLRGKLNYSLSVTSYDNFSRAYLQRGRGIVEQQLNLTPSQAEKLNTFLLDNYKPKNRYYLYDFLTDNCATRIRDIFDTPEFSFKDIPAGKTYRDELHRMNSGARWMSYGIDLILGARCDRDISRHEEMFLPDRLSEHLASYTNLENSEKLVGVPIEILKPVEKKEGILEKLDRFASPIVVYAILMLLYIFLFLKVLNKQRFIDIFSTIFYTIIGIGGLIIAFMWFGTDHVWTKMNWNILWMNPLFLIAAFMPKGEARLCFSAALTVLAVLAPLAMIFIFHQYFSPANAILIAILFFILLSYRIMKKR